MALQDFIRCFLFSIFLLYATVGQTISRSDKEPEFLAPLENHTVTLGRDVYFTCVVNHLQSYKVAWIKSDSRAILAVHTHMVSHNQRFSVTHNGHNTWKLHVVNVQPEDSGTYMCQVNTDPMKSQTGFMKVVIPPDIMDLDDSVDRLTTEEEGEVKLHCNATGTPKPEVTWKREDGKNIVMRNEYGAKKVVQFYKGEQLYLKGILRQEMGPYLCIASNGIPPTVSKRYHVNVRFKPLIKVGNQLVVAPHNSDVTLQCYIESSPQSLNTWYKNNGIKLLPDKKKYLATEVSLNDYTYQLNLTIRNLKSSDYGTYSCLSENTFGRNSGIIQLQELHMLKSTEKPFRSSGFLKKGRKKHTSSGRNNRFYDVYKLERLKEETQTTKSDNLVETSTKWKENPGKDIDMKFFNFRASRIVPSSEPVHFIPTDASSVAVTPQLVWLNWLELALSVTALTICLMLNISYATLQ